MVLKAWNKFRNEEVALKLQVVDKVSPFKQSVINTEINIAHLIQKSSASILSSKSLTIYD